VCHAVTAGGAPLGVASAVVVDAVALGGSVAARGRYPAAISDRRPRLPGSY